MWGFGGLGFRVRVPFFGFLGLGFRVWGLKGLKRVFLEGDKKGTKRVLDWVVLEMRAPFRLPIYYGHPYKKTDPS